MLKHDTLLLVSGSAETRRSLRAAFDEGFYFLEADNVLQTMLLLEQNWNCVASVLLDLSMPERIDASILERIKASDLISNVPVIVLTHPAQPDAVRDALLMGAIEAMSLDTDPVILRKRIQNIVELHRHKWHLEEMVEEKSAALRHSNDVMVGVLSSLIEYRSVESGQHILRIRRFTQILLEEIARSCPRYGLTERDIRLIASASALHDIGKIAVPDEILNKPGKLDAREWEVMKSHSSVGSRMIRMLTDVGDEAYLRYAYNICLYHHERWDGSGYPEGISGDHIPICAQAVGLADAYDALTNRRVYKDAIAHEQAVNMICNGDCGAFSPRILECFKHVSGKFFRLASAYADGQSPKAENFDTQLPGPSQHEELDALQMVRSKYQMLLHYMDAAVMEVDVDQDICQMVYNPDSNLSLFNSITSVRELFQTVISQLRREEERTAVVYLLEEKLPRFFREGLIRIQQSVPIYAGGSEQPLHYEVTCIRQHVAQRESHRLILIWEPVHGQKPESRPQFFNDRSIGVCSYRNDNALTLLDLDSRACSFLGYTREDWTELGISSLLELLPPDQKQLLREDMLAQLAVGKEVELEWKLRHRDGHTVWLLNRSRLELDSEGEEVFRGILLDVSRIKRTQQIQQEKLDRQQIILSQTENVMFEWDVDTDTVVFTENWEELFGYEPITRNLFAHISADSHIHPEDVVVMFNRMHAIQEGAVYQVCEVRIAKSDGRYLWCRIRATAVRDEEGTVHKIVGIVINIDEEKRSTQALQERVERDALTKLLNKDAARQQAEEYLDNFTHNLHCAVFIIDLDNFKYINDHFGHMFGDVVLSQAAREIRRLFRSQDIVARIGGDEFLVLMRGISDRTIVENRCRQLLYAFRNVLPDQLKDTPLSCSIGVSLYPQHGSGYTELFRRADQALYRVKNQGRDGYAIFDERESTGLERTLQDSAVNARIDSDDQSSMANSNIVSYAFRMLYDSTDLQFTIRELLGIVGRQINVSRVYIFENSEDDRYSNNTFEWCNEGIHSEIDNLQNVDYQEDVPSLMSLFNEQGIFYCTDITQLPSDVYRVLEPQNVKSILMCACRNNGKFFGYMGFDECNVNRYWTKEQISLLTFLSEMISVFLAKHRIEQRQV